MRLFGFEIKRAKHAPRLQVPAARRVPTGRTHARMFFNSGATNRLTSDWPATPVPAEWIISRYQRTLVARSREQGLNNDYVKAYFRLQRQNIVGPAGILLQSQAKTRTGESDIEARSAIELAFADWGRPESCDVTGKLSWRAMQAACVNTAARDGEFFIRMVFDPDINSYGFALQLLDPQRCPVDYDRIDPRADTFIRHGIEFNRYGRPVAYHFADDASTRDALAYAYSGRNYVAIPASEIIHGFLVEMPGQKRGLPWLATGLFRGKQMSDMEDAAVINARIGAAKMGVIEWEEGYGPEFEEDEDLELDAEPGAFPILPQGAKLNKFEPTYPSGELVPFVRQILRSLAAGGGVAYENLSQDREGVTWTSIRQGTLEERETYKERQEWLQDVLCARVFREFLPRALLRGLVATESGRILPARDIDRLLPHKWQPRRWDWVDPDSDTKAAERAKNNLLASFSQLIRERGKDPEEVWREIGEDISAMRKAGIPDEFIAAAMGRLKLSTTSPRGSTE